MSEELTAEILEQYAEKYDETGAEETDSTPTEETQQVVETQEPSESPENAPQEVSGAEDDKTPAPQEEAPYEPNLEFTAWGKKHQMDEFIKDAIKDPDTEQKAREMYEKYYSFDRIKEDRDTYKTEIEQIKPEYEQLNGLYNYVIQEQQKGNFNAVFEVLGIPKEAIYKAAMEKLQFDEQPEEVKKAFNDKQQMQQQAYQYQQQTQQLQQQVQEIQVSTRERELEHEMSTPETQSFIEAFESRNGEGSFRQEVINRGIMHWSASRKDVAPKDIISELKTIYGFEPQAANQQVNQGTQSQTTQQQNINSPQATQNRQEPPVIPHASANSTSPVQKKILSVEDLEKEYNQLYG